MLSQGKKQGFEAFLRRGGPGSDRFSTVIPVLRIAPVVSDGVADQHGVRHFVDEAGTTVSECWLECEDDATFEIVVAKTDDASGKVITSDWRARVWVDGQRLGKSPWHVDGPRIKAWDTVYQQDTKCSELRRQGKLQFKQAVTFTDDFKQDGGSEWDDWSGTICITLDHGRLTRTDQRGGGAVDIGKRPNQYSRPKPRWGVQSSICRFDGVTSPSTATIAHFVPAKERSWHTFIFKYRHRVFLEVQGIIAAPPAPRLAARRRLPAEDSEGPDDVQAQDDQTQDTKPVAGSRSQTRVSRTVKREVLTWQTKPQTEQAQDPRVHKRPKVIDLTPEDD